MHAILTEFSKIYMCVSKRRVWLMCLVFFFHQPSEPWAPCHAVFAFADQLFHICWAFPLRCFAHPSTWQSSHQGPSLLAAWTLPGNISTWISTWSWTLANTKARATVLIILQVMLWRDCAYILRGEEVKLFLLPFVFFLSRFQTSISPFYWIICKGFRVVHETKLCRKLKLLWRNLMVLMEKTQACWRSASASDKFCSCCPESISVS